MPMKSKVAGRRNPLRLSTRQTLAFSGFLIAANVVVLVALIQGASRNGDAILAVATAAKAVAPPPCPDRPAEAPRRAQETFEPRPAAPGALQVTAPAGWQWRGCSATDSGGVEVLFAARP
jgi:hypothetical protein